MCIINGEVQKAVRDIVVYKILLENGSSIFRDDVGSELFRHEIGHFSKDFDEVVQRKAVGFKKGFGFTVFGEKVLADNYKVHVSYIFNEQLQIREYKIPKGSLYAKGIIDYDYQGGGLEAIRCEQLRTVRK